MNDELRSLLEKISKSLETGQTGEYMQGVREFKAKYPILYDEYISRLKAAKEEGGVRNGKN